MYKDNDFIRDMVFIAILVLMMGISFKLQVIHAIQKNNSEAIDGLYTIAKLQSKSLDMHSTALEQGLKIDKALLARIKINERSK